MIKTYVKEQSFYAEIDNRIDDNFQDISDLIDLQFEFLNSTHSKLVILFTDCTFINASVSVIIGTLPKYAYTVDKRVNYRFKGPSPHPVLKFMKMVGMYKYYTKREIEYDGKDAVPFNCIRDEKMMDEYTEKIMELAPIKMSKDAKDILSSYIYEIYQNGFFHSKSEIGVFTSGYWVKEKREFNFSIYDMGVGIPDKIRRHFNQEIDSEKCLQIAFVEGFTTSDKNGVSRGLGLTRLRQFIRLNNGKMSIYTGDICCIIDRHEKEQYRRLKNPIRGTLIIINIAADEKHIYVVE